MNEEIKEILDNLKIHNDYYKNQEHNYAFPDYYSLNYEDLDILLNYITNLQKEKQKLNKVIDELKKWLKETQDLTCGCGITNEYIYVYENVLDKLLELKKRGGINGV